MVLEEVHDGKVVGTKTVSEGAAKVILNDSAMKKIWREKGSKPKPERTDVGNTPKPGRHEGEKVTRLTGSLEEMIERIEKSRDVEWLTSLLKDNRASINGAAQKQIDLITQAL